MSRARAADGCSPIVSGAEAGVVWLSVFACERAEQGQQSRAEEEEENQVERVAAKVDQRRA
jgi:hypothetical protein